MKYLIMAFRSLLKKGRSNGVKIVSLAVGLAMGLVLISKVLFEFNYDDFYPDKERVYQILTNYVKGDEEPDDYGQVSGGVAPGMKAEVPEVEVATRITRFGNLIFKTTDKNKYEGSFIMADTCFFDVLPLPMIAGDPKDILGRPLYVMISEKLANNMGGTGQAVGKVFELDIAPGATFTIGGVFKDLPENSHLRYDVVVSLNTIGLFSYDGRDNWLGNDRYLGYVKLYPGTDPESLTPAFRKMQEKYQSLEDLKKAGVDIWYTLVPLTELHSRIPEVRRMSLLLGLLAFALIFTAIMNYVLIVLSALVTRTKEMAVYKSYGADKKEILRIMMTETAMHLFIALLLAIFLIFLFRGKVTEILGVSVMALFSLKTILFVVLICFVVFLISGFIPAILYARIPVAAAFRSFKESRRNWKLASLFIQFVAATSLLVLLVIIWRQYSMMIHDNPGYNTEKIVYCSTGGIDQAQRQFVMAELDRLPVVDLVSTAHTLPFYSASGNNVYLPGKEEELFNIGDLYYVDKNYFPLMEIPVIAGEAFADDMPENVCMIDRKFAEKITMLSGWTDGVLGKEILITEHGLVQICGIYENIRLGSIIREDTRPSAIFFHKTLGQDHILMMKLTAFTPENIETIQSALHTLLPDKEIYVKSFHAETVSLYNSSRLFRDSVMIGGLVVLLISMIGLIGYLQDEINRRRSELAVRRINGGTVSDIITLFIKDILYIALPALAIGCMVAYLVAGKWQEDFSEKSEISVLLFLICALVVLVIITGVIILSSYRKAQENPVEHLRSE